MEIIEKQEKKRGRPYEKITSEETLQNRQAKELRRVKKAWGCGNNTEFGIPFGRKGRAISSMLTTRTTPNGWRAMPLAMIQKGNAWAKERGLPLIDVSYIVNGPDKK